MSAILFGSISTVADTSELQRAAFNQAFDVHALGWKWELNDYREMLTSNGGANRITAYADSLGQSVDEKAVHNTKSEIFRASLSAAELTPRPGVVATIKAAKDSGWKVALVTTTSLANIASLLDCLRGELSPDDFDLTVDASSVAKPKPDPAAYRYALNGLGEQPDDCVAIEDNIGGVRAAQAAGVRCIAVPNQNTAGHDFGDAVVTDQISVAELTLPA